MSKENIDNVRELTAALNRGDADAFAAACTPDVEWEDAIFWTEGPRTTFRGAEGVRDWLTRVREPWDDLQVAGEIVEGGEDTLVILTRLTGRGKGSGLETELQVWQVMWFADGKIAARKIFRGRDGALEAAGLPE